MFESLIGFLKKKDIKFEEYSKLNKLSYMRVGGSARVLVAPASAYELCTLLLYLETHGLPYKVVGRMSNILPTDGVFNGVVIRTRNVNRKYVAENEIVAECGAPLAEIIWSAARLGLGSAEELFMIPATLGGAICNNAGAHGRSVSDIFVSARLYSPRNDKTIEYTAEEMCFSYRFSAIKKEPLYLLSATLRFETSEFYEIRERIEHFAKLRRSTQPVELPSLGSVFKQCEGVSAGYYIDKAGLKGYRIGDAMISDKHAGFIVNLGRATAYDVNQLVVFAKETVKERFGVTLIEEIEIM